MSLKLTNTIHEIIVEDLLTEARGPLAAFENIIKASGRSLIAANDALLFSLKKVNPEIRQLYKASDQEIAAAMARKEFREYRQIIAKGLYNQFEKDIDNILKKSDLSTIDGKASAAEAITKKTGVREELSAEIVKLKSPKKSVEPKPKPKTGDLTYPEAFGKGLKTTQAPFLFLKMAGRNVPVPYLRAYLRNKIQKLSPDEAKRVYLWFFTGVGDANLISQIFTKYGLPKAAVNLTGQVVSKWIFWSTAFSLTNLIIDISKDLDKEVYKSDLDAILSRIVKDSESAEVHWLFPVAVVWNQLIGPLFKGGIIKMQREQWESRIAKIRDKAKEEKGKIDDKIKEGKEKVKEKIDVVKTKVDSTMNKTDNDKLNSNNVIPGSYESFKDFCKKQNPPLTPDADAGNIGIYTVGGVEYEWDGTTFKKS